MIKNCIIGKLKSFKQSNKYWQNFVFVPFKYSQRYMFGIPTLFEKRYFEKCIMLKCIIPLIETVEFLFLLYLQDLTPPLAQAGLTFMDLLRTPPLEMSTR